MSKSWVQAHLEWVQKYYELDEEGARVLVSCDDGTATQWAFNAGLMHGLEMAAGICIECGGKGTIEVAMIDTRPCYYCELIRAKIAEMKEGKSGIS